MNKEKFKQILKKIPIFSLLSILLLVISFVFIIHMDKQNIKFLNKDIDISKEKKQKDNLYFKVVLYII